MPHKKPNSDAVDDAKVDTLQQEINQLPSEPTSCEGKIREIHKKILTIRDSGKKEQLLTELKASSFKGLNQELSQMVEKDGLIMESLSLVLNYLTKKNELAEYLLKTPREDIEQDGLDPIRRRLGPKLEVLGGLLSVGIDVGQDWVKKLLEKAPSRRVLTRMSISQLEEVCSGANDREMDDVSRIVGMAESQPVEKRADEQRQALDERDGNNKVIDWEKLDEAKGLMNEAKNMAKEESEAGKKAVNEKLSKVSKLLQLPPDWNNNDSGKTPDELLKDLNGIIDTLSNAVEPDEPYKSDHEVVQKASGGRALCGIYFSKYRAPSPAERALITMASKVTLSSPNNSHQVCYLKFSKSASAANYVQTVKSSSTNVGFGVGGFYGTFVGEVIGSHGNSQEAINVKLGKRMTSHASVVQYIWIATKTFKIDQEEYILSPSAKKHAILLANAIREEKSEKEVEAQVSKTQEKETNGNSESKISSEEITKSFLNRYGSHLPSGLHTLGGILFRIVEARSTGKLTSYQLTEKAAQQIQGRLSFGLLGGAVGIKGSAEHSSGEGMKVSEEAKEEQITYTFSSQAMGPATTEPPTFTKLLRNNSTWALIDRGSRKAYVPVWEMIRDLGSKFEDAACALQNVWEEREERWRKESIRLGKELTKIVLKDVESLTEQSLAKNPDDIGYGYLPENSAQLIDSTFAKKKSINLSREKAYSLAQEKVMVDPRYRVCVVTICPDGKYMVRCWEASEETEMTFKSTDGKHELIYSRIVFKWKDTVPKK